MFEISRTTEQLSWRSRHTFLLPLAGYAIYLAEFGFGHPNPLWASLLLIWACGATGLAWWLMRPSGEPVLQFLSRHATMVAFLLVSGATTLLMTVSWYQTYYFTASVQAEDTAYYSQVLWNTLHGNFLSGNVQQARVYNPPVANDLAVHTSPVLLVVLLPIYAISPHPLTLLIVRDLVLALAAWPLFLLARDRLGGAAGVAAVTLYLANPAVIAQGFEAFYLLHLVPLPFFWALRAFDREEFRSFLFWTVFALGVREDAAVTLVGFGLWALIRRRKWKWLTAALGLPVVWWLLATLVLQPAFGRSGSSAFDVSLAGGSKSQLGIYQTLLEGPSWILEGLRAGGFYYLYRMLASVAFVCVLGFEGLIALPGLAATIFLARVFYSGSDPYSRFALLPACALIGAAVIIVARLPRRRVKANPGLTLVLLLLLPSAVLLDGAKDAVRARLGSFMVRNDAVTLREAIGLIPATASVAAPNYALSALSRRPQLFYLQYLHMYPNAEPDYILFDRDLHRIAAKPELQARYKALLERVSKGNEYETIWQKRDYFLLRRKTDRATPRMKPAVGGVAVHDPTAGREVLRLGRTV